MTFEEFTNAIAQGQPCPSSLPPALQGLWIDRQGDWDTAHQIVQNANDKNSAWVHAYLHREEGDTGNAGFWYGRAGKPAGKGSLVEEWEQIAQELLAKIGSEVRV